jgi:hypothetical protein
VGGGPPNHARPAGPSSSARWAAELEDKQFARSGLGADARRDVHRGPDVSLDGLGDLAGMDPDPDAHRVHRIALGRRGGGLEYRQPAFDGGRGRREHDVEAVALGPDLGAAEAFHDLANERSIRREQLDRGLIATRLDEAGVITQIGEEEAMRGRGRD